jgi:hypothetical protein
MKKKKKKIEKTPIANRTARTPHIFHGKNRKGEEDEEESLLLLACSSVFPSGFSLTRGSNPTNGSVIKTQKLN